MSAHDAYAGMSAVNWSTLKHMLRSPLAYKYALESTERRDTPAMALGRAVHALVFDPETFSDDFCIWEGGTRRGKEWQSFVDDHEGATILKEDEADLAAIIAAAVRTHPMTQPYLKVAGLFEQPLRWTDPDTGLPCKGRPDWIVPDLAALIDLKTCGSIDGRAFGNDAYKYGYHMQLAHYAAGVELALGWRPQQVLIVAVEKTAPHDVGVFEIDGETMALADIAVHELLRQVKACSDGNTWPGRYAEKQALQLPAWVYASDDDDDPAGFDINIGGA